MSCTLREQYIRLQRERQEAAAELQRRFDERDADLQRRETEEASLRTERKELEITLSRCDEDEASTRMVLNDADAELAAAQERHDSLCAKLEHKLDAISACRGETEEKLNGIARSIKRLHQFEDLHNAEQPDVTVVGPEELDVASRKMPEHQQHFLHPPDLDQQRVRILTHVGCIMETPEGEVAPEKCKECKAKGRECKVYKESVRLDKFKRTRYQGFGCGNCRYHSRIPCSLQADADAFNGVEARGGTKEESNRGARRAPLGTRSGNVLASGINLGKRKREHKTFALADADVDDDDENWEPKLAHQIKALQERESVLVAEEAADQAARHALDNEYHRASQRFDDEAKRRTNELDQLRGTRLIEAPKPDALALPKTEEMEVDCSTPPPIKIEDSDVASEAASSHSRSPSTEANLMTPDSPSLMSKDRQRVKMHVDRIDNTDAGSLYA
nr:hypothetical protein B0A51_00626 [Rachicladosporium sp. CCFEE 5018]